MSSVAQDALSSSLQQGREWAGFRPHPVGRHEMPTPSWVWVASGAAVVGLGAVLWFYLGPDVRRYLKI